MVPREPEIYEIPEVWKIPEVYNKSEVLEVPEVQKVPELQTVLEVLEGVCQDDYNDIHSTNMLETTKVNT